MFLINENLKTVQKDYQASDTLIQLIFYGLEYLELEDFDLKTILAWIKLSLCLYPHHTPQKLGELIVQVSLTMPTNGDTGHLRLNI